MEGEKSVYERRGERAEERKESIGRGATGPGESVVTFLPAERAEMGAFILAVGADSVTASDVPVDAEDAVVGGNEGTICMPCPCRFAVLELDGSGAVAVAT
jgi:hypothetical protein